MRLRARACALLASFTRARFALRARALASRARLPARTPAGACPSLPSAPRLTAPPSPIEQRPPQPPQNPTTTPEQQQRKQDFLNGVCTNIINLTQRKLVYYTGNYDTFRKTVAEEEIVQQKK